MKVKIKTKSVTYKIKINPHTNSQKKPILSKNKN